MKEFTMEGYDKYLYLTSDEIDEVLAYFDWLDLEDMKDNYTWDDTETVYHFLGLGFRTFKEVDEA